MFLHEFALCQSDDVGPRTRIWAFAHVLEGARIGADCKVGDHVFVEGGVVVGNAVTIKNGVQLFSGVTVEDEVFPGRGRCSPTTPARAPPTPRARPAGGPPWCGGGRRSGPTPPSCPG